MNFSQPGAVAILVLVFTIWRSTWTGGTVTVGCFVSPPPPMWWYRCLFHTRKLCRGELVVLVVCLCWIYCSFFLSKVRCQAWGGWFLERLCEVRRWMRHYISLVKAWELFFIWDFCRVWDAFWKCLGCIRCKTMIISHLWVDIPSFLSMWHPCAPVVRFVMR